MNNAVYIYSNPKGTGKTTLIADWISRRNDVIGVLSPKIDGKRYLENISTGELKVLDDPEGTLRVGRYQFSAETFDWAESQIKTQLEIPHQWLVIDEIGPLELDQKKGFYEFLQKLFQYPQLESTKFLMVVRDTEVQRFMEVFGQPDAEILPEAFFYDQNLSKLQGLVLAGGQSKRMQMDKSTINFHGQEQWLYLSEMMRPLTETQWVSINKCQKNNWSENNYVHFIIDADVYQNKGPLTGLLSAHDVLPTEAFMMVAIDYPNIELEDLIQLFNARDEKYEAVCFEYDDFVQPLISILERSAMQKLDAFYANGGESIKQFLEGLEFNTIVPKNDALFLNINTPEELEAYRKNLS